MNRVDGCEAATVKSLPSKGDVALLAVWPTVADGAANGKTGARARRKFNHARHSVDSRR